MLPALVGNREQNQSISDPDHTTIEKVTDEQTPLTTCYLSYVHANLKSKESQSNIIFMTIS